VLGTACGQESSCLRLAEERAHRHEERAHVRVDQPGEAGSGIGALLQHEAVKLGMARGEEHVLAQQQLQAGSQIGALEAARARLELRAERAEDAIGRGAPQRVLGLEVIGQRRQRDAGRLRDVAGGRPVEAPRREDLHGGVQQPVAGIDAALLEAPRPGRS